MKPTHTLYLTHWLTRLKPPHLCLLCASPGREAICNDCQSYLNTPPYHCWRCGIPLEEATMRCGSCLREPPAFDETYAPYLYTTPLDKLINEFKHEYNLIAGKGISLLFCKAVKEYYEKHQLELPQWIVPVPLHWRRQWQRGFNQAAFLSNDLSRTLGIEIMQGLSKKYGTPSQEGLSRKQRLKNLHNSFDMKQTLNGEAIAIVDDVMTTGATANSLALILKRAGAGKVSVWALARTPSKK